MVEPILLKKAREKKKWSQKQLGSATELSASTISRMESGVTPITTDYIIKAAKALEDPELLLTHCRQCELSEALRAIVALLFPDIAADRSAALLKRHLVLLEAVTAELVALSADTPPIGSLDRVHHTLQITQLLERLEAITAGIHSIYR